MQVDCGPKKANLRNAISSCVWSVSTRPKGSEKLQITEDVSTLRARPSSSQEGVPGWHIAPPTISCCCCLFVKIGFVSCLSPALAGAPSIDCWAPKLGHCFQQATKHHSGLCNCYYKGISIILLMFCSWAGHVNRQVTSKYASPTRKFVLNVHQWNSDALCKDRNHLTAFILILCNVWRKQMFYMAQWEHWCISNVSIKVTPDLKLIHSCLLLSFLKKKINGGILCIPEGPDAGPEMQTDSGQILDLNSQHKSSFPTNTTWQGAEHFQPPLP